MQVARRQGKWEEVLGVKEREREIERESECAKMKKTGSLPMTTPCFSSWKGITLNEHQSWRQGRKKERGERERERERERDEMMP